MPLQIARNDITKMMVDAIVNAANSTLFSSGVYGYPKNKSLKVAIDVISDFLLENEMTVYIVIYDKKAYQISEKLISDISEYIDDRYFEDTHTIAEKVCV